MTTRKAEKAYNDKDALRLAHYYYKNHNYHLVTLTYHSPLPLQNRQIQSPHIRILDENLFLKDLEIKHCIQHLVITFSKEQYDYPNAIKTADITCIRLYK